MTSPPPIGLGWHLICGLVTVVGVLVVLGAAFDLWGSSISFGGPEAPSIGAVALTIHVVIIAIAAAASLVAAHLLLGRVPVGAVALVALAALALCTSLVGLAL